MFDWVEHWTNYTNYHEAITGSSAKSFGGIQSHLQEGGC